MIAALRGPLSVSLIQVATQLVRGHIVVEIPGRSSLDMPDLVPDELTLPEPRPLADYISAPCRHECSVIHQVKQATQASRVLSKLIPVKHSLMRARAEQCGLDSSHCH
jgi:hypothetical protein